MSTSTFIEQLYTNFLGRASDPAGKEHWIQQIDSGLKNAAEVSQSFIDSVEFSGVVSPVARLYFAALNRIPDAGGLSHWVETLQNGSTMEEISIGFVNSTEFQEKYGSNLDNAAFLELLYQNVFNRASDEGGKAHWLASMDEGLSRAGVLIGFANSQEHINDKGDDIKVVVQYHGITGSSPTQADIDAAITTANPESVIASLYASADYSGEAVPGLSASGVVVDGYVSGATVFIDANGDGVQNEGEVSTTTDALGNFDFGTNAGFGNLVMTGGTDISTGKPFEGVMTAPGGSTVVNPLTTMIDIISQGSSTVEQATATVLSSLGLSSGIDLLNFDPIAESTSTTATAAQTDIALAIQSAAIQVNTLVSQTAALIGGTGTTTEEGGINAAYAALAATLASTTTGSVDLSSGTVIQQVIQDAAVQAGADAAQTTDIGALASDASQAIANLNKAIDNAVSNSTDINAALTEIAAIQIVAEDIETALAAGAQSGDVSGIVTSTEGTALSDAVDTAGSDVGDTTGDGTSDGTPTPTPTSGGGGGSTPAPSPTFTVTVDGSGVVTFAGTATGNITLSVSGAVATFTRGGVTAATKPDPISVTAIMLGGQVLEGNIADFTALTALTGLGKITGNVIVTDAIITLGEANTINGLTSGVVTATISDTAGNLGAHLDGTGNAYTVTVTDSMNVASANGLDAKTTGVITATLSDTAANLATLTGTGNAYTVTVTDAATIAQLTAIDAATTGTITYTAIADASATLASNTGGYINGSVAVTATDATSVANANIIDGLTSGVVTATLSDTAANLVALTGTGNAYTVTVTDAATIAELTAIDAATTGTITYTAIADASATLASNTGGFITGSETVTSTDATSVANANIIDGLTSGVVTATLSDTAANLATLTGTGNAYTVTVTDAATIAELTAIDAATTGAITYTAIADASATLASNTGGFITGSETVTSTDATSVANANIIDGLTSGVVTATLSDTAANLAALTGTGNAYTVAVIGAATIAELTSIDAATTGTITYTAISDTSATLATNAGSYITGSVAVTTTNAATVAQANAIDAATTGVVTATLSDTAANLAALTGTGNAYTVTVTDAATIAQLTAIDAATTGTISYTAIADASATLASNIGGYINGSVAVTATDAATIAELTAIDAATTGAITYTAIADGSATLASNTGGYITGSVTVTSTDATSVANANTIDGLTSGVVTATLSDTAANLATLTGTGNAYTVTVTDAATIAQLTAIDAATTGAITVAVTDTATALNGYVNTVGATTVTATTTANQDITALDLSNVDEIVATGTVLVAEAQLVASSITGAGVNGFYIVGTDSGTTTITGSAGDDVIDANNGINTVNAGDGDDVMVIVGTVANGQYGVSDSVAGVFDATTISGGQLVSDVASGGSYNGGNGTDTLHIYGTVDMSTITLTGIENIIVHSDVTFTAAQLEVITTISGDDGSAVRVSSGTADLTGKIGAGIAQFDIQSLASIGFTQADLDNIATISSKGTLSEQGGGTFDFTGINTYGTQDFNALATGGTNQGAPLGSLVDGMSAVSASFVGLLNAINFTTEATALTTANASLTVANLNMIIGNLASAEILTGGSGIDLIVSGASADTIETGDGTINFVISGAGADTITGGAGVDFVASDMDITTLDFAAFAAAGADPTALTALLNGGGIADNDIISTGANMDFIMAGFGDDTITGGAGFDLIVAGEGADFVTVEDIDLIDLSEVTLVADTIHLTSRTAGGVAVGIGFDVTGGGTDDVLQFTETTFITGNNGNKNVLGTGSSVGQFDLDTADFSGIVVISDQVAANFSDVGARIAGAVTNQAAGDKFVFMVDNGTDTMAISWADTNNNAAFDANEFNFFITLIGVTDVTAFDMANFSLA